MEVSVGNERAELEDVAGSTVGSVDSSVLCLTSNGSVLRLSRTQDHREIATGKRSIRRCGPGCAAA